MNTQLLGSVAVETAYLFDNLRRRLSLKPNSRIPFSTERRINTTLILRFARITLWQVLRHIFFRFLVAFLENNMLFVVVGAGGRVDTRNLIY